MRMIRNKRKKVRQVSLIDHNQTSDDSYEMEDEPKIRLFCFAHSLQLTIRDGLKDAPRLSGSSEKCKRLSRKARKSTKIADLLEVLEKRINQSNVTRWNSEYLLIKSIVGMGKKSINEITMMIDEDHLQFSDKDFAVLQETIDILESYAEITFRIQSESAVTASLVVPSIVHLMEHFEYNEILCELYKNDDNAARKINSQTIRRHC